MITIHSERQRSLRTQQVLRLDLRSLQLLRVRSIRSRQTSLRRRAIQHYRQLQQMSLENDRGHPRRLKVFLLHLVELLWMQSHLQSLLLHTHLQRISTLERQQLNMGQRGLSSKLLQRLLFLNSSLACLLVTSRHKTLASLLCPLDGRAIQVKVPGKVDHLS